MLDWLKKLWRGAEVVEFESAFDLAESVDRLRAATKKSVFQAVSNQQAVGTVTETRVSLQRVIPMMGNSFKPFFVGCFVESSGKIVLRGRFTMQWFAKLFMAFWFGLNGLMMAAMVVAVIASAKAWIGVAFTVGMLCFGLGMVRLGQWFSRNDPIWLSNVINAALANSPRTGPTADKAESQTIGIPIHIRPLVGLIALAGIAVLVSSVFGVRSFHATSQGVTITPFQGGELSRYLGAIGGIFALAWAYGIFRQYRVAWWAGLMVLGYAWFNLINALVHQRTNTGTVLSWSQPVAVIYMTMAPLVLVIWSWWWYAQRIHFNRGA
jgi:hypothetical protein